MHKAIKGKLILNYINLYISNLYIFEGIKTFEGIQMFMELVLIHIKP
jgi:hypothetical protein